MGRVSSLITGGFFDQITGQVEYISVLEIHPKTPFKPMDEKNAHVPHLYTHPSTDPTLHLKRHPDPTNRFSTIHPPHGQTQTDGWSIGDKPVRIPAYALYIDDGDAAKKTERKKSMDKLLSGINRLIDDYSSGATHDH